MRTPPSRKLKKTRKAHHVATIGRVKVAVYKRTAPNGSRCFMVPPQHNVCCSRVCA